MKNFFWKCPLVFLLIVLCLYGTIKFLHRDHLTANDYILIVTNKPRMCLMIPKSNPHPTKLCEYFHGHDEGYDAIVSDWRIHNLAYAMFTNGWAIATFSGGEASWGNGRYLSAASNTFVWSTNQGHFTKVVALMQSMGGIGGNHMMTLFTNFQHVYEIYPAVDLGWIYTNSDRFQPEIEAAYQFHGSNDFPLATRGFNPIALPTNLYSHADYRLIASDSDTAIDDVHNAKALTNRLKFSSFVQSVGHHGDRSNFKPTDVVDFFNQ